MMAGGGVSVAEVQELLDEGRSVSFIAKRIGEHHETVRRLIKKKKLEIYEAFDEISPQTTKGYCEWDFEDKLDEWDRKAWRRELVLIPRSANRQDIFTRQLLSYVKDEYGGLKLWAKNKGDYSDNFHTTCTKCANSIPVTSFSLNVNRIGGIEPSCPECNYNPEKEYHLIYFNRRRAIKQHLPEKWTVEDRISARQAFQNACALTCSGECDDDHFIPLATGHGGSYFGNMYPLDASLNSSKHAKNPFKWFEANRQRFELDQSRFDSLVAKLAEQNGLTSEEFREYTDWCFANPRNLSQIKRDNARYGYRVTSVELWREATGRLRVESVS
jgi:hypothetical protein